MFSVNRIIAFLTPVFTTAAVALSHLALTRLGFHISPDALVAVETTVAASAAGAALKWLHGHQRYESYLHDIEVFGRTVDQAAQVVSASQRIRQR